MSMQDHSHTLQTGYVIIHGYTNYNTILINQAGSGIPCHSFSHLQIVQFEKAAYTTVHFFLQ